MKRSKILIVINLLFLEVFFTQTARGQHLGAASDNYVTTQQVIFNPASIADPKPFADIRIFGASQLIQNTYMFLPNSSFTAEPLDNFSEGKKYNGYSETDILGPAYTRAINHAAIGINFRVRNHFVGRRLPSNLAKFTFEGLNYPPQHNEQFNEKNFWIKDMAWGELGLTYASLIEKRGNELISAGGTIKILNGMANVAIYGKDLSYEVDTMDVNAVNYEGRLTMTVPGVSKGWGVGLDLGIEYKKMLTDNNAYHVPHSVRGQCLVKEYKYKLGVSMIDLGYINFNKETTRYKFDGDSVKLDDYVANPPNGISEISQRIDQAITSSGAEVEKKDKSFATLPLSFVVQGDYNFENHFYLNAQLLIGMQQRNFDGAERMSMLTVTPRYERKKYTVGVPISVYRYGRPGVGFYARAWWLSVGTNNWVPILLKRDLYGSSVYASLNIPIFSSPACREHIAHKGDYCPKPKLKLFHFNKGKKAGGKNKKKDERKKGRKVKRSKK